MSILTLLAGTHCWQHLEVPRYFLVLAACRVFTSTPREGMKLTRGASTAYWGKYTALLQ